MSNGAPAEPGRTPRSVASRRCTRVAPKSVPSGVMASRFWRMAPRASSSISTNRQKVAPRDNASIPNAPEPANRSMTRRPCKPGDHAACSENIEHRLSCAVRRRARRRAFRRAQRFAFESPGDHAHQTLTTISAAALRRAGRRGGPSPRSCTKRGLPSRRAVRPPPRNSSSAPAPPSPWAAHAQRPRIHTRTVGSLRKRFGQAARHRLSPAPISPMFSRACLPERSPGCRAVRQRGLRQRQHRRRRARRCATPA